METTREVIELNTLTHHQVLTLFLYLELVEDEKEWEAFFQDNDISGDWLVKADSHQFIKDRFVGMRNVEAKFLLTTIEKFKHGGVPVCRLRKADVNAI